MVLANGSEQSRLRLSPFQQFDNDDFQQNPFVLLCKDKINDVEFGKF